MARGRMISKTLGCSKRYARLRVEFPAVGLFAQALYPMLVSHSDDFGRQIGDAFTVKHAVWPTAPEDEGTFNAALDAMQSVNLITRYDDESGNYLQIVKFDAHQQGLHKRSSSHFPEPAGNSGNTRNVGGRKYPEIPSELNLTEQKGTQRSDIAGREDVTFILDRFNAFWSRYPRQDGKDPAWKIYLDIYPTEAHAAEILAGVERFRKTSAIERALASGDTSFIPLAKTWLKDLRWEDGKTAAATAARVCQHRHTPPCADAVACSSRYLADLNASPAAAGVGA